jgi:hypothetical protein
MDESHGKWSVNSAGWFGFMGKIEVYFKNLNYADDKTYYHEFIVWTPDKGPARFIRGGPESGHNMGSGSGGGSGSAGFSVGKTGVNVPFGAINVQADIYEGGARDWAKPGVDPSQTIITGSDQQLASYWQKMVTEGAAINKENTGYAFAGPNSNTVVTTLLEAAGLPLPKDNGLNGTTPAPGAEMSLLNHHYSAGLGYEELAENAGARGVRDAEHGFGTIMHDIGNDFGAAIGAFRKALKTVAATASADMRGMGLYGVAMAAGRPGLGGFAPIAGMPGRQAAQKSRALAPVGEAGVLAAGLGGVQADAGVLAARQGDGAKTSYRTVVAQARHQAAAGRARREADAAALYLPMRGAGLAGLSFAPRAGGGAAGGSSLHPAVPGSAGAPGLRRRNSVHEAVSVAEAASSDRGEAGAQEFAAGAEPAPAGVRPADIERAVEDYFFRQSRLPPTGGAGFNPLLSPVWAGLKIPG